MLTNPLNSHTLVVAAPAHRLRRRRRRRTRRRRTRRRPLPRPMGSLQHPRRLLLLSLRHPVMPRGTPARRAMLRPRSAPRSPPPPRPLTVSCSGLWQLAWDRRTCGLSLLAACTPAAINCACWSKLRTRTGSVGCAVRVHCVTPSQVWYAVAARGVLCCVDRR